MVRPTFDRLLLLPVDALLLRELPPGPAEVGW